MEKNLADKSISSYLSWFRIALRHLVKMMLCNHFGFFAFVSDCSILYLLYIFFVMFIHMGRVYTKMQHIAVYIVTSAADITTVMSYEK